MGRAVGTDQAGTIDGKQYRQILDRHIVDNLIVSPLHEAGVDSHDRFHAFYRQSGGTKGDGPEAIWMQLAEQREKLTQRMTEAAKQQEAVEAFLAKIGRSRYREMLRLRFLSYLTIEEASARMGYSYDAGKRLSAQAMRAARAIWEACHAAQ